MILEQTFAIYFIISVIILCFSGVVCFDDLIQHAGSLQALHEVESKVQADDGFNIQFTSVMYIILLISNTINTFFLFSEKKDTTRKLFFPKHL